MQCMYHVGVVRSEGVKLEVIVEKATAGEDNVAGESVNWVEGVVVGATSDNDVVVNVGIVIVVASSVVVVWFISTSQFSPVYCGTQEHV